MVSDEEVVEHVAKLEQLLGINPSKQMRKALMDKCRIKLTREAKEKTERELQKEREGNKPPPKNTILRLNRCWRKALLKKRPGHSRNGNKATVFFGGINLRKWPGEIKGYKPQPKTREIGEEEDFKFLFLMVLVFVHQGIALIYFKPC